MTDLTELTLQYISLRQQGRINDADNFYITTLYPAAKALQDERKENA